MLLDEVYADAISLEPPSGFEAEKRLSDLDTPMASAPSREDFAFELTPSLGDIYITYLKDAKMHYPSLDHHKLGDLVALEGHMAQALYKDGYAYEDIICVMAKSPTVPKNFEKERDIRWTMAALRVTQNVNPLVTMLEVEQAKPLRMTAFDLPDDKSLYFSAFKTFLTRKPELRLQDVDDRIVKFLCKNQVEEKRINDILSFSPQFSADYQELPEDDRERFKVLQDLQDNRRAFIQNAMKAPAVAKKPEVKTMEAPKETLDSNEVVLERFMKELRTIRSKQKEVDAVSYWKTVMDSIKRTFEQLDFEKIQSCCRLLIDWCEGAERATREMALQENPEVRKIQRDAAQYIQKTQLMQDDWNKLAEMLVRMETASNKLISETIQSVKRNPLLQNPSVYTATPFEKLVQTPSHKPEEFYFSALRKAVLDSPGIDLLHADLVVKDILGEPPCRFNSQQKAIVLAHSPRYYGLSRNQREEEAAHWITVTDQQRVKGKSGGVSPK